MIKYLKDIHSIDFCRILLLRAKELELNDQEGHILLLIMTLKEIGIKTITPMILLEYTTCTSKELDIILSSLIKKKLVNNQLGSIQLHKIEELLLKEKMEIEESQTIEINILEIFEKEFGRSLSPMEMNTLREWKESYGYEDEHIIMALKEAVKGQVLSFRYMEGILKNWAKNGINRRFVETPDDQETVPTSHYEWWK